MKTLRSLLAAILLTIPVLFLQAENDVIIFGNHDSRQIQFAINELKSSLTEKGLKPLVVPVSEINRLNGDEYKIILLNTGDNESVQLLQGVQISNINELKDEGFIVQKSQDNQKTIWVLGRDDAGVMYGGLEVAEIIRVRGIETVGNQLQNPYMKVRGTKFNIPLDLRTPTYSEFSDAAQNNMEEMWNFEFWKEYIDNLARYRYNTISLWSMHPFPSMVKVPEYPDIALDDVHKSTADFEETYSLHGRYFDAPEIVNNYEVIKEITIDEKIDFWQRVMAYGKSRNVQFYIVTWNIWVYGTEGKYGITDKLENPVTVDYFRKSVKQLVLTYPDLAGIGLTTGENMYAYTATQKEEWAFATYGKGVLDALEEQPDRKFTFIHRQHETDANEINTIFQDVIKNENINFVFSFKYAQAHVYSSTIQNFHHNFVEDIKGENLKTLWTLRNDDNYYFRWGAPDFVREFIKNIPYDISEGYYFGSDNYVWGREFLGKNSVEPRELEILKHWYSWKIWGRLGYNPDMGNERFVDIIQSRFPNVEAQEMFNAWQSASMVYPLVTGFHWAPLDFQWYIEASQAQPWASHTPSGFHDINRFITLRTHNGTDNISIPDYTRAYLSGSQIEGTTPLQVADQITHHADFSLNWVGGLNIGMDPELRITIDDIKTMALMGKHYAHKIRAATYLSLFRESLEREWYEKVHKELNLSADYFRRFASVAMANYHNPLWTNRVGYADWKKNFEYVLYDITANGGRFNLSSMTPTEGGTILEAKDADYQVSVLKSDVNGFTGEGYLGTNNFNAHHQVKWTYNAEESGEYTLEFRYTLTHTLREVFTSPLLINGKNAGEFEFWNSGNPGVWVWDRVTVKLEKGENTIEVSPIGRVLLDHLNIIKY